MISSWCIVIDKVKNKVLVLKRSKASNNKGQWDFPGGSARGKKNHRKLIYKELLEEVGFKPPRLSYIYSIVINKKRYHYYVYYKGQNVNPELSSEHTKYKWVTLHKLKFLNNPHKSVKIFTNHFYNQQ